MFWLFFYVPKQIYTLPHTQIKTVSSQNVIGLTHIQWNEKNNIKNYTISMLEMPKDKHKLTSILRKYLSYWKPLKPQVRKQLSNAWVQKTGIENELGQNSLQF